MVKEKMCKTVSEMIALIEQKKYDYDWNCLFCGGSFGGLELWENHSPEKTCEADRHWYYYTCKKCGHEWSIVHLIEATKCGRFTKQTNFLEELKAF